MLRGRCRDCGVKISPRYWLVEAAMAAAFVLLAYFELFTGGANLPGGPVTVDTGAWGTFWHPEWELIGVYFYHCAILAVLLTMVLIDLDGRHIPWKLVVFGVGLSLVVKSFLPLAHVKQGAQLVNALRDQPVFWGTSIGVFFGAAVGGLVGFQFDRWIDQDAPHQPSASPRRPELIRSILIAAVCGVLVGQSRATIWGIGCVLSALFVLQLLVVQPFFPPISFPFINLSLDCHTRAHPMVETAGRLFRVGDRQVISVICHFGALHRNGR